MYIVIYNRITKKIVRVIEKTPYFVAYGYSDDCAEKVVDEKPEGDTV